jgi:hypothetical protein
MEISTCLCGLKEEFKHLRGDGTETVMVNCDFHSSGNSLSGWYLFVKATCRENIFLKQSKDSIDEMICGDDSLRFAAGRGILLTKENCEYRSVDLNSGDKYRAFRSLLERAGEWR